MYTFTIAGSLHDVCWHDMHQAAFLLYVCHALSEFAICDACVALSWCAAASPGPIRRHYCAISCVQIALALINSITPTRPLRPVFWFIPCGRRKLKRSHAASLLRLDHQHPVCVAGLCWFERAPVHTLCEDARGELGLSVLSKINTSNSRNQFLVERVIYQHDYLCCAVHGKHVLPQAAAPSDFSARLISLFTLAGWWLHHTHSCNIWK